MAALGSTCDSPARPSAARTLVWTEVALVFLVFALEGASPVPAVNEAHYLGKAIHYWNPDWISEDFFLDSHDTHSVFYITFGWLSLWLSPTTLAWVGRIVTWLLLAWAWRRLSFAVVPRAWWSVLTAALFVWLGAACAMAGEWVVGGVEAKGFAYVAVFLGLESLVRGRWNSAWLLLGLAALFHVLVGGWSVAAAALAWCFLGGDRPPLRSMGPGLVGGFLLALPSLILSLELTWNADPAVVEQANQIYVFHRLYHHLNPAQFAPSVVLHFAVLMFVWVAIRWATPPEAPAWRMHAFVAGAVAICMAGIAIAYATVPWPKLAAALLRLYWFRLADVAVPLGVALGGPALLARVEAKAARRRLALATMVGLMLVAAWHVGQCAVRRVRPSPPGAYNLAWGQFPPWRDACEWIAQSGQIPPDARFLTPRLNQTFRWYAQRSEVATWKDIPQDAVSIVQWWQRLRILHGSDRPPPEEPWFASLSEQGEDRLRLLGEYFDADYVLTEARPRLNLPVEYENNAFIVYRLRESP